MATANLTTKESIDTTNDSVVIVNNLETIVGGRTLDVTGFTDPQISAGHVIIVDDATGKIYKPLPVTGIIPLTYSYVGILVSSLKTDKAMASVMVRGTVNEAYAPYTIKAEVKIALSLIRFVKY